MASDGLQTNDGPDMTDSQNLIDVDAQLLEVKRLLKTTSSAAEKTAAEEKEPSDRFDAIIYRSRQSNHGNIDQTLTNLQVTYKAYRNRVDDELKKIDTETNELQSRMNAAEANKIENERQIQKKEELIKQLEMAREYLGKQFASSRKEVVRLDVNLKKLEKTLKEQNEQIEKLELKKKENENEISRLNQTIADKNKEITDLKASLKKARADFEKERDQLQSRLDEKTANLEQTAAQLEQTETKLEDTENRLGAELDAKAAADAVREKAVSAMRHSLELDLTEEQASAMRDRLDSIEEKLSSLEDTELYANNGDTSVTLGAIKKKTKKQLAVLRNEITSRVSGMQVDNLSTQVGVTPRIDMLSEFIKQQTLISDLAKSDVSTQFIDAVKSGEERIERASVLIDEVVSWTLEKGMKMVRWNADILYFAKPVYPELAKFVDDTKALLRRIEEAGGSPADNARFMNVQYQLNKLKTEKYFKTEAQNIQLDTFIAKAAEILGSNMSSGVENFLKEANSFMNANTDNVRLLVRFKPQSAGEELVFRWIEEDQARGRIGIPMTMIDSFQPADDSTCAWLANKEEGNQLRNLKMIFPPGKTNGDVFSELKQFVDLSKEGFPVILSVYGHSGAGKTYTMFGSNGDGIVQQTMKYMGLLDGVSGVQVGFVTFAPTSAVSISKESTTAPFTRVDTYDIVKSSDGTFAVTRKPIDTSFSQDDLRFTDLEAVDIAAAVDELRRSMWFPTAPDVETRKVTMEFKEPVGIRPTPFNKNGSSRLHICVVFKYEFEGSMRMLTMIDMAGVENLNAILLKLGVNKEGEPAESRIGIRKALDHEALFYKLFTTRQDTDPFSFSFLRKYLYYMKKSGDWESVSRELFKGIKTHSIVDMQMEIPAANVVDFDVIEDSMIVFKGINTKMTKERIESSSIRTAEYNFLKIEDNKTKVRDYQAKLNTHLSENKIDKATKSYKKIVFRVQAECVANMIANMAKESIWINESLNTFRWWLLRERDGGTEPFVNPNTESIAENSGFAIMDDETSEDACEYTFWRKPTRDGNPYHFIEILDSIKGLSNSGETHAKIIVIANMHSTGSMDLVAPAAMFVQQLGKGSAQTGSASSQSVTKQDTFDNGETESTGTDDEYVKEKKPVEQGKKKSSPSKPDSEQDSEGKGIDDGSGLSKPDSEQDSEGRGIDDEPGLIKQATSDSDSDDEPFFPAKELDP